MVFSLNSWKKTLSYNCNDLLSLYGATLFVLFMLFVSISSYGQKKESKIAFRGYLKNMSTFVEVGDSLWYENLTHNRLNLAWYATDNFTAYVEVRNRILVGDFVKNFPGYAKQIDGNNDFFELSTNIIDNESVIFNTMVDRAYLQWSKDDWEIKVGRQRVNWGMNLAWNPNDLFNAYSFFDFDYEERRGVDAIRINYFTGVASSIEVAAKLAQDIDRFVAAAMWKVNKWNYDIQFLGGVAHGDVALGLGWAGNIGLGGFKGEMTILKPFEQTVVNRNYDDMFIGSVSLDYSFKNSFYINGSVLYNSQNPIHPGVLSIAQSGTGVFTMRDLSTTKWSAFAQSAYQFSPLIYGSFSVMGYPGTNAMFLNPALSFSLTQNIDLGVFGQLLFDNDVVTGNYSSSNPSGFLRLKWSF